MKDTLKSKLRAVFLVEASGDLELIRSQLERVGAGLPMPALEVVESFYKSVHKLKGACRAINLIGAEKLGYQIEYLFRAMAQQPCEIPQAMFSDVRTGVEEIGRHIEHYAAEKLCPINCETLEALNRHLQAVGSDSLVDLSELPLPAATADSSANAQSPAKPDPVAAKKQAMNERLAAAFRGEARDILHNARAELRKIQQDASLDLAKASIDELLRAAHTLKGSSRLVQMHEVGRLAHDLESVLQDLSRADTIQMIRSQLKGVGASLDLVEDEFADLSPSSASEEVAPAVDANANSQRTVSDFYRIDSVKMDALFKDYSELLILHPELTSLGATFATTKAEMLALMKEEHDLRAQIGADLHRPEFAKVASYVNYFSRQLKSLSNKVVQQESAFRRVDRGMSNKLNGLDLSMNNVQQTRIDEVLSGMRQMVRGLAEELGKSVDFSVVGYAVEADRTVLQKLRAPLIHLLRNALDHGVESSEERVDSGKPPMARLELRFELVAGRLHVHLSDDGRGFQLERLKEKAVARGIFTAEEASRLTRQEAIEIAWSPHLSTAQDVGDVSGRGMGLSSVVEDLRLINGEIEVSSEAGRGTNFHLTLPLSCSTSSLTLVRCGEEIYGVHSKQIEHIVSLDPDSLLEVDGRLHCRYEGEQLPFNSLASRLGLPASALHVGDVLAVLIVRAGSQLQAVCVDGIVSERKMVLRELPAHLTKHDLFSSGFLLPGGSCGLVVNLDGNRQVGNFAAADFQCEADQDAGLENADTQVPRILVVDDSYTSRTLEVGVLESYGFIVHDAVDGMDALKKLRHEKFDLIVSDIEMPRMDGFELLKEIKAHKAWRSIPVIMISSLDDDKIVRKGLSLGADGYIVKKNFEHQELIETIQQFL